MIALLLLACTSDKAPEPVVFECLEYTADCSDARSCWLVSDERAYIDSARAYRDDNNATEWADASISGYTDADGIHLCALCPADYETLEVLICSPV